MRAASVFFFFLPLIPKYQEKGPDFELEVLSTASIRLWKKKKKRTSIKTNPFPGV